MKSRPCDLELGRRFAKDVIEKAKIIRGKGYPLDIDPHECELRNKHDVFNSKKVYHPCSVSIGKFLRFNSLFVYHRYSSHSRKDHFVNIDYPFSWKWSQGIESCQSSSSSNAGWSCLFKDFSAYHDATRSKNNSKGAILQHVDSILLQLRQLKSTRKNSVVQIPLYGKLLEMLSTPSEAVLAFMKGRVVTVGTGNTASGISGQRSENMYAVTQEVSEYVVEVGDDFSTEQKATISQTNQMSPPSVSMHVRHGDSCDFLSSEETNPEVSKPSKRGYKRPCLAIEVYMSRLYELKRRYGVKRVYLATDSAAMIEFITRPTTVSNGAEVETRIESKYKMKAGDFEWVFVNISRDVFDFKNGWVDFYNSSVYEVVSFSAVADLALMKRGDIFLGTFSSHFSKLAYYVMSGKQMRLPPFISLDVPLSCDTGDDCAISDISKRDQTVLDIIQWAPECLRKVDGGWMDSNRDPCGIYSD